MRVVWFLADLFQIAGETPQLVGETCGYTTYGTAVHAVEHAHTLYFCVQVPTIYNFIPVLSLGGPIVVDPTIREPLVCYDFSRNGIKMTEELLRTK